MGYKAMRLSFERDIRSLYHLWRWKLATTSTLATKYFSDTAIENCYMRLWKLEKGGFVKSICARNGQGFLWTLDLNGYEVVKSNLLETFREHGYKSEYLGHDLLVSAIHQGEWLMRVPEHCEIFTEQELRRLEFYPEWVPKTNMHRPDGYWLLGNGSSQRIVALELELNSKSQDSYLSLGSKYELDIQCDEVIWVVGHNCNPKSIYQGLGRPASDDSNIHSFFLLRDFLDHGWQAKAVIGKSAGKSIREILATSAQHAANLDYMDVLLDLRKKPINPITRAPKIETVPFR